MDRAAATSQPPKSVRIAVANSIDAMAEAKHAVESFCTAHRVERSVRRRVLVVVDELINNAIRHGCSHLGADAQISLELTNLQDQLRVRVRDNGTPPFNPLEAKAPDLSGSVDERVIGGLGIHLVRTIAQGFDYELEGGFNVITAVLDLDPAKGQDQESNH